MARTYLDFERPVAELDNKIEALIAEGGEARRSRVTVNLAMTMRC